MTVAEKLTQIAENVPKVYEAGVEAGKAQGDGGYDFFWDIYQENGKKTNYNFAFSGASWNADIFKPKYPLSGMTYANSMFQGSHRLIDIPYTIDLTSLAGVASTVFSGSTALKTIKEIVVNENNTYTNCFNNCTALEEVRFTGAIGQSGINFQWSTKLSKASITNVINALSSSTSGLSVTFSKTSVNTAFGINVDDATTYPEGSEYYTLRHSKDNWTVNYI